MYSASDIIVFIPGRDWIFRKVLWGYVSRGLLLAGEHLNDDIKREDSEADHMICGHLDGENAFQGWRSLSSPDSHWSLLPGLV